MQARAGFVFGSPFQDQARHIRVPGAPLWGLLVVVNRFHSPMSSARNGDLFLVRCQSHRSRVGNHAIDCLLLFAQVELIITDTAGAARLQAQRCGLRRLAHSSRGGLFWTWLSGVVRAPARDPMTVSIVVLRRMSCAFQFPRRPVSNFTSQSPQKNLCRASAGPRLRGSRPASKRILARRASMRAFFDAVAVPALAIKKIDADRRVLTRDQRAMIAEGFLSCSTISPMRHRR